MKNFSVYDTELKVTELEWGLLLTKPCKCSKLWVKMKFYLKLSEIWINFECSMKTLVHHSFSKSDHKVHVRTYLLFPAEFQFHYHKYGFSACIQGQFPQVLFTHPKLEFWKYMTCTFINLSSWINKHIVWIYLPSPSVFQLHYHKYGFSACNQGFLPQVWFSQQLSVAEQHHLVIWQDLAVFDGERHVDLKITINRIITLLNKMLHLIWRCGFKNVNRPWMDTWQVIAIAHGSTRKWWWWWWWWYDDDHIHSSRYKMGIFCLLLYENVCCGSGLGKFWNLNRSSRWRWRHQWAHFQKKNMCISPVTKTNDNWQSYNSF